MRTPSSSPADATVVSARILDPAGVRAECATLKQVVQFDRHALLVGLPEAVLRQLGSPLVPTAVRLVVAESAAATLYAIVAVQAAGLQLRCLVPLRRRLARDWLRECIDRGARACCWSTLPSGRSLPPCRRR